MTQTPPKFVPSGKCYDGVMLKEKLNEERVTLERFDQLLSDPERKLQSARKALAQDVEALRLTKELEVDDEEVAGKVGESR